MDNTQNKTEGQNLSLVEFYEKFQNLVQNAPKGAEYFAMIKAPEGATPEKCESQITACQAGPMTLVNLFANSFREAPVLSRSVKLALGVSDLPSNPLEALMSALGKCK